MSNANAHPHFGRIQTRQQKKRPIELIYNKSMFDRASDSVSSIPVHRDYTDGHGKQDVILIGKQSISVPERIVNEQAQNEDEAVVFYPEKARFTQTTDQQARKKKQLREMRALASISQSSTNNKMFRDGRHSSLNKDNEGKQQHHYGLTNALWPKQTSTQWMTAGRSSLPQNADQRDWKQSTNMQRPYKNKLVDTPVDNIDSPSQINSRGRISLDPYDLNVPQLPSKLKTNSEKQKFKTIQHFFPKQSNERVSQHGRMARERPSYLYGDPEKYSRGPPKFHSDAVSP